MKKLLLIVFSLSIMYSADIPEYEILKKNNVDLENLHTVVTNCYTNHRQELRNRFNTAIAAEQAKHDKPLPQEEKRLHIGGGIGQTYILEIIADICKPTKNYIQLVTELTNSISKLEAAGDELKQLEFNTATTKVLVHEFGKLSEELDGKF